MDGVAPSRKKPRQPLKDRETDRAYQYRLAQMMAKQALVLAQGKVPEPYAWCLFTDSVYTKGQELFYSYGPLSNIDLFFSWGFVIENNRHDVMSVQLPPAMTRMYYYHVFMGIPDLAKPLMLMNRIKGEDGKTYSQVTNRALLMEGKDFRPLTLLHVCRMFVASNWPGNLFHLNSVSNLFLHRHETMSIHHELMACEVCFKTLPDLVDIVAMKKSAVAKFDQALAMGTTAPTYKYRFAYLYKKIIAEGFLSAKMYFFRRQVFIHQNCRLPTPLEEEYFMK